MRFDQHGCGRPTNASLDENTKWHMIDDMKTLRRKMGITKWQVSDGSWGSTPSFFGLGHTYATKHLSTSASGC
jgi:hypothetical protein